MKKLWAICIVVYLIWAIAVLLPEPAEPCFTDEQCGEPR